MFSKKYIFFMLLSVVSAQLVYAQVCGNNEQACKDLKNSCKCYCGVGCVPREKIVGKPNPEDNDNPIFIHDDPRGNYCYCKQRDVELYYKNKCDVKDAERRKAGQTEQQK